MVHFGSDSGYDNFMGRYSTRLAPRFADFAGITRSQRVVDVGAGTGALSSELIRRGAEVAAADPAPQFVEALRARLPAAEVRAAPAEALPWADATFDASLSQLVVMFMSDAPAGVQEMRRVVRPGGTVAVCMWDREGMQMLAALSRARETLGTSSPSATGIDYRRRDEIESLFADGFGDIRTELLEVDADYSGFDEFWAALTGGGSESGRWAASLTGDEAVEARREVRRELGEPAGPFTLRASAWAVRAAPKVPR
jgi:ubiquinone/menaquinone biosynthesis C-methylase UbiE